MRKNAAGIQPFYLPVNLTNAGSLKKYFAWIRRKEAVRPEERFFCVPLPNLMN